MKKRYKKKINLQLLVVMFILCTTIILTIGYSAFSSELDINGLSAYARIQKDIRLSGIEVDSVTGNAISNWENFDTNSIMGSISLPTSSSTVTYNIKVANLGNVEATISDISDLPNNLQYTLNDYSLNDVLCDDEDSTKCTLGSITTISLTVGYAPNGFDNSNTDYNISLDFTFSYMVDAVAKMDNRYFDTLQEAITAAPDNTETTVLLLKNTSEIINVSSTKNIILNLNGSTLSNSGNNPVISNYGILKVFGGVVTSDAATNGAINNEGTGTFVINGGRVVVTGGRQALYNNKGTATITGNAYLSSSGSQRAAVQNVSGGTMTINGGTIISTGFYAVRNDGSLTIGVKDGNISTTMPYFQSVDIGIYTSSNISFYDGIIKSKAATISQVNRITDIETGYGLVNRSETIDGETYNVTYLGISKAVTFNPNSGSVSESVRYVEVGHELGPLPTPIRSGYIFQGWFTASNGGTQINEHTIINDTVTYHAHWEKTTDVALIGNTVYATLQDAINAVPTNNTETTIVLRKDVSESVKVLSGQNIVFDFDNYTLTNSGNKPIFETAGTIKISNGNIQTSAEQSAINITAGRLIMDGGQIVATSSKQAIYITGGTVEIGGTAYLSSLTSGKPSNSNMERGTVHNVSGTLIITGGTIVGSRQQAVSNQATLTIGVKDGNIDGTTPVLIGGVYGLKSDGTFNFYDGIIKGKTSAINGSITEQEDLSILVNGTEVISGTTYKTAKLELTS